MTLTEKESLKNEIIIELYNTGRINKMYFGQLSKSSTPANQLKKYIEIQLYKNFMLRPDSEYLDDCYQELFVQLQNIPTERFIELYELGDNVLMSYVLRIIVLKLFSIDKRTMNPKHSFAKSLDYASVFNKNNAMINHIEVVSDDIDVTTNEDVLIIYDGQDDCDEFELDYGFKAADLLERLTSEQRFVFTKILDGYSLTAPFEKRKRGKPTRNESAIREQLFADVREIQMFIKNKNESLKKEYR